MTSLKVYSAHVLADFPVGISNPKRKEIRKEKNTHSPLPPNNLNPLPRRPQINSPSIIRIRTPLVRHICRPHREHQRLTRGRVVLDVVARPARSNSDKHTRPDKRSGRSIERDRAAAAKRDVSDGAVRTARAGAGVGRNEVQAGDHTRPTRYISVSRPHETAKTDRGKETHKAPAPPSPKTFTATILVRPATPLVTAPTTPATAVPCPFPSVVVLSTVLTPQTTRPSSSGCDVSTPVSTTYTQVPAPAESS